MKRIYLSLLLCLAYLLASAQEPLNGDSLASDFRYLVKELAATHPDPYSGFGGKVFFYEQAFHLENELRRTPGTKQTFFDKVSIFLSNLQDGHTYLLPPTANQQANQRYLALEVRTIPDGIILQGIPETYKDLLGSRITTINGDSLEEVLARTAAIQASENLYDRYANLCRSMPTEHFLRQLFPEMKDNLHLSLLTPDGKSRGLTLPLLSRQEVQNTPMQHNNSWKAYTDKQLAYQFIDNDKQIMLININSIMARDNFEYMQKQGLKDLYRQIGFYYRDILKQDMPADTLQAIRQLPSLSEVFAHMLKEMKKEASSTLIIDLRNNSGGWTPIVLPTLYQLFGDHFLQTDMDIEFYRIISPLYMQKLQTNLQDFNQAYGTDYAYGDYTFSTDEADTTNIEQRRTDFIENCMSSVPEELRKQQGKALYTPEHIYVITNERTFSAAFHYTFYLWKMGATLVGIPSGQAPNTYMEQTLFRLPYTGMQGSISNSIQICFPGKDRCAHTLYPDLIPTYQDYQRYNFDVQTEILYLLDKIKSAPHSHTNLRRRIRSKNKAPFTDKLQAGLYFHISIKRLLHHLVRCRVGENHRRLERLGFFKVHQRVGHDNNDVIRLHLTGCRTVQANFARATLALNNVGFKTFTVIIVGYIHLLAGNHVGGIHQIFINRNASHIVQVRFRDAGTMDFRLQHFNHHIFINYELLIINYKAAGSLYLILSIRRTSPQNTVMQPTA